MYIYIIIGLVLVLIIYFFATYNNFKVLINYVKEAFSTMDVYLKKRWDLVPNLVSVVKAYATHEKDTLEGVTKYRAMSYDDMTSEEKLKSNEELTTHISRLMAIAEAYPELKANEEFQTLSKQLVQIEDDIANARKYYNGTVKNLNNAVESFPSNIIAKICKFKEEKFFEAEADDRENVEVKF